MAGYMGQMRRVGTLTDEMRRGRLVTIIDDHIVDRVKSKIDEAMMERDAAQHGLLSSLEREGRYRIDLSQARADLAAVQQKVLQQACNIDDLKANLAVALEVIVELVQCQEIDGRIHPLKDLQRRASAFLERITNQT